MQFQIYQKIRLYIPSILLSLPIVLLFLSLDSNSGNFIKKNYLNADSFLQIREIFPHILLFAFLLLNLIFVKKKNIYLNYLSIFLFLFFLLQFIGLMTAKYFNFRNEFSGGFHFLIIYLFFFNYFFFFNNYSEIKNKINVFKIVLLSLFISHLFLTIFFFINTFFIFIGYPNQYGYGGYQFDYNIFGTVKKFIFNSNGISRSFLVCFIFILCLGRNISVRLIIFLRYLLLFLLAIIIYYYQSRFSFFSLIVILVIYSFFNIKKESKIKVLKNLFYVFLLIFSSILFAKGINNHISNFKNNPIYYKEKNSFFSNLFYKKIDGPLSSIYGNKMPDRILDVDSNLIIKEDNFLYQNKINTYMSGRFELISLAIDYLKNNKLIILTGGGPEFDRYIVNADKKITYYKDIGNGYINLILTGGVFLFILFILFILNFFMSVILMFQKFHKDNFFIFSVLLVIVFLLRGIVEKSFTIWGIDMLYFFLCLFYLEVIKNKKLLLR